MKKFVIASVLLMTALAAKAQAYAELGYLTTDASTTSRGVRYEAAPTAVRGIFGYDVDPYMAIEGMALFGADDARVRDNGFANSGDEVKVGNSLGLYIKPKYKLSNRVELFARVGVVRVKGSVAYASGGSETRSESGLSYGAGLGLAISKSTSINFDYMQYLNKDDVQINGFTVGLGFKF